jgi:hypothetical protein
MLRNTQNSAMAIFPNGISPVNYVPPPNRPYTPPWNSKDACRVYCDCGGSYDTDVRSTPGRWLTFIRNGQIDPKVRHEQAARHQKWQKNPQKAKIRQVVMNFVGNFIKKVMPLQSCHSQRSKKDLLPMWWRLFKQHELASKIRHSAGKT